MTFVAFLRVRILPLDGRTIERAGQIPHDRIQQGLHADVIERRPAKRRLQLPVQRRHPQQAVNLLGRNVVRRQIRLHDGVVEQRNRLQQLAPPLGRPLLFSLWDFLDLDRLPFRLGVEIERLHLDQVDDPAEAVGIGRRSGPDRNLHRHRMRGQPAEYLVERPVEIGPDAVHLVDEANPRDAVFVGLPPDRLALSLDPLHGTENHQRPVEHPQAPLDLGREIDVPRRVDDVDRVLGDAGRLVLPAARDGGRIDRDPRLASSGSKSVTVVPSSTSPILWEKPV